MFGDLLKKLMEPQPATLPDDDARLALAALMVRIGRSDGAYQEVEQDMIERILARRYDLTLDEANMLRVEAETLESEAPDTVRFSRAVKDAVPHEEREHVIEALWEVVLADGERDHEEDAQLRLLANLLGINDRDSNLARQRVEKKQE